MMYFKVDFYDSFSCQMCGTCCRNEWLITVAEECYQRNADYFKAAGKSEEFLKAFIPLSEGSSPDEYAFIAKQAGGGCWFLESGSLCRLHREVGHEHLDYVCQTFPRYPMDTARGTELTLSFSCPQVVEIASRRAPIEIIRTEYELATVNPANFVVTVYPEQQPSHSPLHYYFELEHHFIDILQCRVLTLGERLQLIRATVDRLRRINRAEFLGQEINRIFQGNYQLLDSRAAVPLQAAIGAPEFLVENFLVNLIFKKIFYRHGLERGVALLDRVWRDIAATRMAAIEPAADLALTQAAVIALEIRYAHDRTAPYKL